MGCIVNGPGEAKEADIGAAGAGDEAVIFRKGEIIRRVPIERITDALTEELERLLKEDT